MRRTQVLVLIGGLVLLVVSVSVGLAGRSTAVDRERRSLAQRSGQQAQVLNEYAARAASIILLTANNRVFAEFANAPGDRAQKVDAAGPMVDNTNAALDYLERLYPDSIGEACFIDADGAEVARIVRGERAAVEDLSFEEGKAPFFAPTFALPVGEVFHAKPYVSPDTDEWVIANSTLVPTAEGAKRAMVHFEVTVESFRRHAAQGGAEQLLVVDADSGAVVINTETPQQIGAPLGDPSDTRFSSLTRDWTDKGHFTLDGRLGTYERIGWSASNANRWYAIALAPAVITPLTGVSPSTLAMAVLALLLIGYAAVGLRRGRFVLMAAANTDALTGLYNRRRLSTDMDQQLRRATTADPLLLVMCDLNGFKAYNDTFGHPAGDALLARLGAALDATVQGQAYRLGGDEFCVLIRPGRDGVDDVVKRVTQALSEHGDGFSITTSYGAILLPEEAADADAAMRLVDLRMYEQKNTGRVPADAQTTSALLRALRESDAHLAERLSRTADLAAAVTAHLGLPVSQQSQIRRAAELHDLGKMAIPDNILLKVEPLTADEWEFLRQSPIIGERITAAAPSLAVLAPLIRSAREHYDGTGYPDQLVGNTIPLGSRVIAACAALTAMTSTRPYAQEIDLDQAMTEIRLGAGKQFDPTIVAALLQCVTTPALAK
jgi:diguanylate cyclase (GGDEF)-like protein